MRSSQAVLGLRHSILSSEIAYCSASTSILSRCTTKAPIAVEGALLRNWRGIRTPVTSSSVLHHSNFSTSASSASRASAQLTPSALANSVQRRLFSSSRILREVEAKALEKKANDSKAAAAAEEAEGQEFGRSEKASRAAQINLRAKLQRSDKNTSESGFGEVWRLIKIARPEAKWLSAAFICLLLSSSITMLVPFSIGKIIDAATNSAENKLFGLDPYIFYAGLGGILCIGAASNFGRIVLLRIVGERVVTRLRSRLFRKTYSQDAEFFDANRVGDLISRLSSDAVIVGKSITQNLSDGLRALVTGVAGFTMMAYVSVQLSASLLVMLPPVALCAFFYGRNIRTLSRKIQRAIGSLSKIAEERLSNVKTSQSFAGEILEVHRYNTQARKIFNLGKREALVSATFFGTTGLMGNLTILGVLAYGGTLVKSGAITIGELTTFLMYTAYAGSSLFGLSSFYSELMKGVGAASRLFELQDRNPSISPTKGNPVKSARGVIRFEDIVFSYPTRPAVNIFEGLSFSIEPGTNVAIVGPSGGGKSTISSLLLRFYDPNSGRVLINDTDITTMNLKQLRRRIGVVSQEPVLFSGTISDNIAYGKPHATRAEIVRAAKKANCTFIADFPDGLDTQVGARGAQLSGGQKQRISIARALIKDPDILILDEATSALDAESETLVNEALQNLMANSSCTTISIAHRLSTIMRSDRIIVLNNNGTVAETGTFKELSVKQDGAFKKLMEWQLTGGEDPSKAVRGPPSRLEVEEEIEIEEEMEALEEDEEDDRSIKAEKERKASSEL